MVSSNSKDANLGNSKEGERISTSKVAYSDPQMVEISLYEIKNFLITETIAKVIILVGSLFIGGILSAVFSKIPVHRIIIIASCAILFFGIILDVYLIKTKLSELERKGARKWK